MRATAVLLYIFCFLSGMIVYDAYEAGNMILVGLLVIGVLVAATIEYILFRDNDDG